MIFNRQENWQKCDCYRQKLLGEYYFKRIEKENVNSTWQLQHFIQEFMYEKLQNEEAITLNVFMEGLSLYLMDKLSEQLVDKEEYDFDTLLMMYQRLVQETEKSYEKQRQTLSRFVFLFLDYLSLVQHNAGICWYIDEVCQTPKFIAHLDKPELIDALLTTSNVDILDTIHFILEEIKEREQTQVR